MIFFPSFFRKLTVIGLVFLFIYSPLAVLAEAENSEVESPDVNNNNVILQSGQEETIVINDEESENNSEDSGASLLADEEENPYFGDERAPVSNKMTAENDPLTGALLYRFPIKVPPGRNGMQPGIELKYNSQNTDLNNIFGYGWDINVPYIERINREGIEDLYEKNYFYSSLSGELKKIKASSSTEEAMTMSSVSLPSPELKAKSLVDPISYNKDLIEAGVATLEADGSVILKQEKELKNNRTRNSKEYLVGYTKDGQEKRKSRIYGGELHYFDIDTMAMEDIDTTLVDRLDGWTMDKAQYKSKLKKELSDEFITFQNEDQEIYFSLLDYSKSSEMAEKKIFDNAWSHKAVTYEDALGKDIDIEIKLNNEALIKDAVIQNEKALGDYQNSEYYEITFKLTSNKSIDIITDGKQLSKEGTITTSNMISITDGNITSYIWPAVARDSNEGFPLDTQVELRLTHKDNYIELTKLIPTAFLASSTFPVRTDATVSYYTGAGDGAIMYKNGYQSTWEAMHDYTGTGEPPLQNHGTDEYFQAVKVYQSNYACPNCFVQLSRGYLVFDTSSMPDDATIYAAEINIYVTQNSLSSGTVDIVSNNQASSTQLEVDDYDELGTTILADPDYDYFTVDSYNAIELGPLGINEISTSSYTRFGLRYFYDTDDTPPDFGGSHSEALQINFSEYSGTSTDPYLEVSYVNDFSPMSPAGLEVEGEINPMQVLDQTPEFSAIFMADNEDDYAVN